MYAKYIYIHFYKELNSFVIEKNVFWINKLCLNDPFKQVNMILTFELKR